MYLSYWNNAIVCLAIWAVVTSTLLFFTWNEVIAHVTKLKKIKFIHAILVIATLAALCAPKFYAKMRMKHHSSHYKSGKHECSHYKGDKSQCPYHKKNIKDGDQ